MDQTHFPAGRYPAMAKRTLHGIPGYTSALTAVGLLRIKGATRALTDAVVMRLYRVKQEGKPEQVGCYLL